MNQTTVMFKKEDVLISGCYIDWYCNEDYYLWIRMLLKGFKFKNLDKTLVYVRIDNNYFMRRSGWKYFKSECKLQRYMLSKQIK